METAARTAGVGGDGTCGTARPRSQVGAQPDGDMGPRLPYSRVWTQRDQKLFCSNQGNLRVTSAG